MIRHQAIAQDAALVLPCPFGQQCQIDLVILLGMKGSLAVVAPLSDVVGYAGRHPARCSPHEPSFSTAPDVVNRDAEHEFEAIPVYRRVGVILSARAVVPDKSNGYEAIAEAFTQARTASIGPKVVQNWATRLQPRASILDIGCGNGVPISEVLLHERFEVYGVDASETLVAKFKKRFPGAAVECGSVEESAFFNRTFDGVVAWGLMFLLGAATQRILIAKVARALNRRGHFLFTSPREVCSWIDGMTGLPSISLGHEIYQRELAANGLALVGNDEDENYTSAHN